MTQPPLALLDTSEPNEQAHVSTMMLTREDLSSLNHYSPDIFKTIVLDFTKRLAGYTPPTPRNVEDVKKTPMYQALYSKLSAFNMDDTWFEKTCIGSVLVAELPYPEHSFEEKLQIAEFTWYFFYVEDLGGQFPLQLKALQEGLFLHREHENKVLEAFVNNMADMYKFWNPIVANLITVSGLDLTTGRLLESDEDIINMPMSEATIFWPSFLRRKTGAAEAYALMIFTHNRFPDMSAHIQTIDDMCLIINLTNDIVSYHKEGLAGEKNNYVNTRARTDNKSPWEVLQEIASEIITANSRVLQGLGSEDARRIWRKFLTGYLDFYFLFTPRYRLNDIQFHE